MALAIKIKTEKVFYVGIKVFHGTTKDGSTLLFSWGFVSYKTIDSNGLKNVSHQVQSDDAERLKSLLHFLLSSLSMGWPYEGCGLGSKVP